MVSAQSDVGMPQDAMVIVAALVSRVEALVVASMLEAAGILVHVGAAGHASAEVNSLALGGHRLWVPASQHGAASAILLEVLGEDEWRFSFGLRRAVIRLLAVWAVPQAAFYAMGLWVGLLGPSYLLFAPLTFLAVPVNPQGRGDYYLKREDGSIQLA